MFELAYWHKALQSPEILTGFLIDLLPLIAVIALGWGAGELVMLYWLENLLIGLITLMRIVLTGTGKRTISGGFHALFFGSFFTVHYGGFCMAHGVFLVSFFWGSGAVVCWFIF